MFGMMLELGKPEPTRFHTWKGEQPRGCGSCMAQGAWTGIKPIGILVGEQDRVCSWAERFLNLLEVSRFFFL